MLFSLLQQLGCKAVNIAGLDGHSGDIDYYDKDLKVISDSKWFEDMNFAVGDAIEEYAKQMDVKFITPSIYERKSK
jgi:hypothetical protein